MDKLEELMQAITNFDCKPAVFRAVLCWDDKTSGYSAYVLFRSNGPASELHSHGNTAIEALSKLLEALNQNFSKCPHCGNYKHTA